MADTVAHISFRCALCNKPFDKQSTLKRHGYYCRSRNNHTRAVRLRSCVACAKAKTRCDGRSPKCSRCATRNILCRSQVDGGSNDSMSNIANNESQLVHRSPRQEYSNLNPFEIPQSTGVANGLNDSESGLIDTDFPSIGIDDIDWNMLDTNMEGISHGLDNQPLYPDYLSPSSPVSTEQYNRSINSISRTFSRTVSRNSTQGSLSSIPSMPSYNLRSFRKKSSTQGASQTTAMLMVHILTSYPLAMRDQNSLPPFIHSSYFSEMSEADSKQFEALSTCMSLMQMINSNAPGSRKLFWKNVRFECERIQDEWPSLDKYGLQATMQALLIYMLLRLQEGETPDNNFDTLLLSTLWNIPAALIRQLGDIRCGPYGLSYGTTHKDWVFEESRRRLACIFTALNMLFSMEPGGLCPQQAGFLMSPLPARKQLWDARDEEQWNLELSRTQGAQDFFGVLRNGQMVKIREKKLSTWTEAAWVESENSQTSNENWQEWCASMEGLGSLIMLTVSLWLSSS